MLSLISSDRTGIEATKRGYPSSLFYIRNNRPAQMVQHNFTYPLGHIVTAKFWQNVKDNGLHYTVADTGWAKLSGEKYTVSGFAAVQCLFMIMISFLRRECWRLFQNIRLLPSVPLLPYIGFLIKEDLSQYDLNGLEYCVVAGEPLNPEVYNQFLKSTGLKLHGSIRPDRAYSCPVHLPWMEPKPGSMGKPAPGYDVLLLDEDGNLCDTGQEGQIVIRTSRQMPLGMFDGYYRDKEKTKTVWHDDMYFTGDMAWYDEDGYFWFVGRADDVIKSSGYRIGPFEVESALMEHPAVLECAITAVLMKSGAIIKATVVLAKGYTASDRLAVDLQKHVKVTAPYISILVWWYLWMNCPKPSAERFEEWKSVNETEHKSRKLKVAVFIHGRVTGITLNFTPGSIYSNCEIMDSLLFGSGDSP